MLTSETHARAVDVLRALVVKPGDCLLSSGSRQAGLGNVHSDWDYYLVLEDEDDELAGGAESFGGPDYLDCEVLSTARVRRLGARLREAADAPLALKGLTLAELDLYYRLIISEPMVNPRARDSALRGFSLATFTSVYTSWTRSQASPLLALAVAAVGVDPRYAAILAREAFSWATECLLAQRGQGYPNRKWWFERASACVTEELLLDQLWSLRNIGAAEPAKYVHDVARFCLTRLGLEPPQNRESAVRLAVPGSVLVDDFVILRPAIGALKLSLAGLGTLPEGLARGELVTLRTATERSWAGLLRQAGVLELDEVG
ncbi:MAG: hypothetical protein M3O32_01870 [Actinomycetota bacterium]|nr:hypothetical protein [Actinomycetota bacterium]